MEMSVDEHAAESSQPCLKGAIRSKITTLEEAYGEYQILCREWTRRATYTRSTSLPSRLN